MALGQAAGACAAAQPGQGPQIAQALGPPRNQVREWAEQMGIDTDQALEADRQWRSAQGTVPGLPDGRPDPVSGASGR